MYSYLCGVFLKKRGKYWMLSTLLERFLKGIDDASSAPIMHAHLEMLKTAAEILEKENDSLKNENANLRDKLSKLHDLEKQIAELNQFEDLGIIKIKLGKDGNRLPSCYCPQCGGLIANPENIDEDKRELVFLTGPFSCQRKCGYRVNGRTILRILQKWDKEHSKV